MTHPPDGGECAFEGCGRPADGRNKHCSAHRKQAARHPGQPMKPLRPRGLPLAELRGRAATRYADAKDSDNGEEMRRAADLLRKYGRPYGGRKLSRQVPDTSSRG